MSTDFFNDMAEGLAYYIDVTDANEFVDNLRNSCTLKTVGQLNLIEDYKHWAKRLSKVQDDDIDYLDLIRVHDQVINDE